MKTNSHSFLGLACLAVLACAGGTGCLCPPCGAAAKAGATGANSGPSPVADVSKGSRQVIWDGDTTGSGAQGWDSCDQKPKCQVKVGAEPSVGVDGSIGLKFHGEGGGWIGMGWNLFGWYPENAGVDLSPYSHLTFQVRVEGGPDPGAAAVLLGCSSNKFDSADAPIEKFMKGFADGKWHKVSIPVSTFTKGKGAKWDPHSFWEFRISTWSGTPRKFDIYIDDLAAEKL